MQLVADNRPKKCPAAADEIASIEFKSIKPLLSLTDGERRQRIHDDLNGAFQHLQIAFAILTKGKEELVRHVDEDYETFGGLPLVA